MENANEETFSTFPEAMEQTEWKSDKNTCCFLQFDLGLFYRVQLDKGFDDVWNNKRILGEA